VEEFVGVVVERGTKETHFSTTAKHVPRNLRRRRRAPVLAAVA